jgi:RimJ/RimL family protein N-acetyltransferase
VAWPVHTTIKDTEAFLAFSESEWAKWPAGGTITDHVPKGRDDGTILGSTGLAFETPHRASTGFVLARDAWGSGFASEALDAMVRIAAAAASFGRALCASTRCFLISR